MVKLSPYKISTRLNSQTKYKSLKQMYKGLSAVYHPYLTLTRISIKPRKKLCDFTGLPASYTCPRTFLRYFDLSVYKYMQSLPSEISENYYENKMYGCNNLGLKKQLLNGDPFCTDVLESCYLLIQKSQKVFYNRAKMAKNRVGKEIDRVYQEIHELVEESKDPKEKNSFKRKQLKFLKADVHKPKIPFRRCMLSEQRRKDRRAKAVQRKLDIGVNRRKHRQQYGLIDFA